MEQIYVKNAKAFGLCVCVCVILALEYRMKQGKG